MNPVHHIPVKRIKRFIAFDSRTPNQNNAYVKKTVWLIT